MLILPPKDPLLARLQTWTMLAATSASSLVHLYTRLGDDQQRQRGIQISDAARTRLRGRPRPKAPALHRDDPSAELDAWRTALEASTGVLVFLTLAMDASKPVDGLRGQLTHFTRASKLALEGLRCAFPDGLALQGTKEAIDQVIEACHLVLSEGFGDEFAPEVIDSLLESIRAALESYVTD